MIQPENTQTRKDEVRFRTSDMRRALGKYLASRVTRSWKDDFIDESTGEIVTIDRTEILFEGGQLITQDLAARITFSINAGEITDVEVSNQNRAAKYYTSGRLMPYKLTASIQGGRKTFLLQAQSVESAIEVAKDFIELNYEGAFTISKVENLKGCIIINNPLRKLNDEEKDGDARQPNEEKDHKVAESYYNITGGALLFDDFEDKNDSIDYKFIIRTDDVDTGTNIAKAWLRKKYNKELEDGTLKDIIVSSATPFPISAVIPSEFCMSYKEIEQ